MRFNVDVESLANELELEIEDIKMLLVNFLQVSNDYLFELDKAIESEDFEQIAHNAHSIKGSSANLGLKEISFVAKEIELNAKANKRDFNYKDAYAKLKKEIEDIADV